MAKVQSFEDKVKKHAHLLGYKSMKLVYAVKSPKTGAWRFPSKFVKIPDGTNEEQFVKETVARLSAEIVK